MCNQSDKMEVDEVYHDLLALRQLYVLLSKSGHGLQDANSGLLNERAQILLLHLLDDATAGLFEAHSKILAIESGTFNKFSPSQPPEVITKIYYPLSEAVDWPASNFISPSIKPELRKKQCWVCTQNSLKHQNSDRPSMIYENEVNNFSHQDQQRDGSSYLTSNGKLMKPLDNEVAELIEHDQNIRKMKNPDIDENPSFGRSSAGFTSSPGIKCDKRKAGQYNVGTNDLSDVIGLAIKRIDVHISSLQHSTRNRMSNEAKLANSPLNICNAGLSVLPGTLSQLRIQSRTDHSNLKPMHPASSPDSKHVLTGNMSFNHNTGHLLGRQKVKTKVRGIETPNQACQVNHPSEFVHGFRLPLSQDNEARKPPMAENKVINTTVLKRKSMEVERSKQSLPPCSMRSMASVRSGKKPSHIQNSRGRMVMRPTLLHHPPTGLRMSSSWIKDRQIHKKSHKESENKNSESSSSSCWTTQQTKVFSNETNKYPSSPRHQESPMSSGSEGSSISNGQHRFSSPGTVARTSHGHGRFRRLKNKLGLILHHHHHHHHHHHNVGSGHNFMRKHLRKIFHGADKKKVSSKGGYGKLKKSTVKRVSRRNQVGHFQAMAEGLRSHLWKSKGMKLRGVGHRRMEAKKMHWWQMFRHHRGVKLPNRGHVKIGYGNKGPQKVS